MKPWNAGWGLIPVVAIAVLVLAGSPAQAEPSTATTTATGVLVEYLYIDANEDQASGGHTALRIDEDVFHFQYDNGLLTMARDSWADFQLSYRGYQNRNIQATRLDISRATHDLLRSSFVQRYLTQSRQIDLLADTRRDVALLQALLQSQAGLELPGLGFFEAPVTAAQTGDRRQQLRAAISAAHGKQFLLRRQAELQGQLATLPVEAVAISARDFRPGNRPRQNYAFNQRYGDIIAGLHAIDILHSDAGLSEQALGLAALVNEETALAASERVVIEQMADRLQQRLVGLVGSRRPDWGVAMLLGLARLEALRNSLELDRWIFIDVLASDATIIDIGPRTRELLPHLQTDARDIWLNARDRWLGQGTWHELSYARMEAASANWLELGRLAAGANDWRIQTGRQVPRGLGALTQAPQPEALATAGNALLQQMRDAQLQAEQYASEQLGYKLLSRNCVSELFTTIDMAFAEALRQRGEPVNRNTMERETQQRLGERFTVSPVPFVSADQVQRYWHSEQPQQLLSLRRLYMQSRYREDSTLVPLLRESNTLTSTVYRRSDQDSYFIFFTDGNTWARPALGLVNLTAALGATAVGALQWPFDGGSQLKAGLRGALFSMPELGFINIRKGSSTWLAPPLREVQLQ